MGQVQAFPGIGVIGRTRRTLVKSHHDIGTDGALDVHHPLGSEKMLASVYVGAELATFLAQLADAGQGEDLESAAVGKHRTVKTIEFMQASRLLYYIKPRL